MRSISLGSSMFAGALGGLAGSLAMNQFQAAVTAVSEAAAKRDRLREGQPNSETKKKSNGDDATVKAAKAISIGLFQHHLTEDEKKWAGTAVHYGLGTVLGAAYGALAVADPRVETASGAVYGTAVWLGADETAIPLAGLSGPPTETPASGHLNALASHLVFGLVTHFTRKLILS